MGTITHPFVVKAGKEKVFRAALFERVLFCTIKGEISQKQTNSHGVSSNEKLPGQITINKNKINSRSGHIREREGCKNGVV